MAVPTATLLRSHLETATSIMYRETAEDQLDQATLMHKWGEPRPVRKGRSSIQLHRFDLGAQNVQTLAEGELGAGLSLGDDTFSMRPSYYGDFTVVSEETETEVYSNYKNGIAQNLGSRAALTIDAIHRNVFDGGRANYSITPISTYLDRAVLGQITALMSDGKVMGGEPDGMFGVVISPLAAYDLLFDFSSGGVTELARTLSAKENKMGATAKMVAETAGARVYNSTLVTAPSSSTRRCYVFGKNGYAFTNFVGKAAQFGENQLRNFNLNTYTSDGSIFDPMKRIPMAMSYTFTLGVAFLDTTDYRLRTVDINVSLGT